LTIKDVVDAKVWVFVAKMGKIILKIFSIKKNYRALDTKIRLLLLKAAL
jgi:hypothetical protein